MRLQYSFLAILAAKPAFSFTARAATGSTRSRCMVTLHGSTTFLQHRRSVHSVDHERPPDPATLVHQLQQHIDSLQDWFQQHDVNNNKNNNHNNNKQSVVVITGAGLSTESGIPDYRGHAGSYHAGHKPVLHDQFVSTAGSGHRHRQRYWGRAMVAWRNFHDRQPNAGHYALAALEHEKKVVSQIITQNVDRLHSRAGSTRAIELHGRTDQLVCMNCGATRNRNEFQMELEEWNPDWLAQQLQQGQAEQRADGDAELFIDDYSSIQVPPCTSCETGFLKPDVVFFGDSVPRSRVEKCQEAIEECDGVLVVGSSLAVHSAYRHVRAASAAGKPICIVNVGPTRAEREGLEGILKIEAPAGPTLQGLVDQWRS